MARCEQLWHRLHIQRVGVGAEPPGAQPCPQEPAAVGRGAAALTPAQPCAEAEPAALQPVPDGLCRPERLHLLPGGLPPEPLRARLGRNEPHEEEPGVQKPHTRQFAVWCHSEGGGHSSRGRSLLQEASDVFCGAGLFFGIFWRSQLHMWMLPVSRVRGWGRLQLGSCASALPALGLGLSELWKKYRQPGVVGSWNWFSSLDSSKDCICSLQKCS